MMAKEYTQIQGFLKRFIKAEHPSIMASLKFFRDWLDAAAKGSRCPASKTMGMLSDRGGTPELMLQWVLTTVLYARRVDNDAARAPFAIFNMAIKGFVGSPRGWCKKGYVAPKFPQMAPSHKERKAGADYIRTSLRALFPPMFDYFDEKERLFNERARVLQGKFPVLRTRTGKADPRCRAERRKPDSPYAKPGNPTGINQYTRRVDPITERKPKKPPSPRGPIPYHRGGHKGNQNTVRKEPHATSTKKE
jgi:hypothetical protein